MTQRLNHEPREHSAFAFSYLRMELASWCNCFRSDCQRNLEFKYSVLMPSYTTHIISRSEWRVMVMMMVENQAGVSRFGFFVTN